MDIHSIYSLAFVKKGTYCDIKFRVNVTVVESTTRNVIGSLCKLNWIGFAFILSVQPKVLSSNRG